MSEFNSQSEKDEVPDAAARYVLVLAVSLALHLALAFGIQVRPVQPEEQARAIMEVRIQRTPPATPRLLLSTELAAKDVELQETVPSKAPPVPPSSVAEPASVLPTVEMPLLEDPTWYPAKQVDVHPSPLQPVHPEYPPAADAQNIGGSITLLLLIDERGVVREASTVAADPEGYFEESALEAFRAARFVAAQKNGRAVKSRVLIRVTYEPGGGDKSGTQPPAPFTP